MPSEENSTSQPTSTSVAPVRASCALASCSSSLLSVAAAELSARERILGVWPAAIAFAVGAMSARETNPSMRVEFEVSTPW